MQRLIKLSNKDAFGVPEFWIQYQDKGYSWSYPLSEDKKTLRKYMFTEELHCCCPYCELHIPLEDIELGVDSTHKSNPNHQNNIDHIYPQSNPKYGDRQCDYYNLISAHKSCNKTRGSLDGEFIEAIFKNPDEYIKFIPATGGYIAKDTPYKDDIEKFFDKLKLNTERMKNTRMELYNHITDNANLYKNMILDDIIRINRGFPSIIKMLLD